MTIPRFDYAVAVVGMILSVVGFPLGLFVILADLTLPSAAGDGGFWTISGALVSLGSLPLAIGSFQIACEDRRGYRGWSVAGLVGLALAVWLIFMGLPGAWPWLFGSGLLALLGPVRAWENRTKRREGLRRKIDSKV